MDQSLFVTFALEEEVIFMPEESELWPPFCLNNTVWCPLGARMKWNNYLFSLFTCSLVYLGRLHLDVISNWGKHSHSFQSIHIGETMMELSYSWLISDFSYSAFWDLFFFSSSFFAHIHQLFLMVAGPAMDWWPVRGAALPFTHRGSCRFPWARTGMSRYQ